MSNIIDITDFNAPELDIYARLPEVQLLHIYEPKRGIFIAESPKVIERALDAGYQPISFLVEDKHIETQAKPLLARCEAVPVYRASYDILTQLTGFSLTRGMLCAMYRSDLPTVRQVCAHARRIVVLEDVVNPTNVGAIFRSAAALNMDGVLLTPSCSDPLYRRAARVSMGTVFQIPWTYLGSYRKEQNAALQQGRQPDVKSWNMENAAREKKCDRDTAENSSRTRYTDLLHELGFRTVAMALREDSVGIDDPRLKREEKLAVILGTEGDGLAASTIENCDYTVRIPMSHGVDSLNVAAASAVAFWELGRPE